MKSKRRIKAMIALLAILVLFVAIGCGEQRRDKTNAKKPEQYLRIRKVDKRSRINTKYLYGFISSSGRIILKPTDRYEWISEFSEGLAVATVDSAQKGEETVYNKTYINTAGKEVIKSKFNEAYAFQDGLAVIQTHDLKWGAIDKSGAWVIKPVFDELGEFHDGLAVARSNSAYGYVDRSGEWRIKPRYPYALDFVDGLAIVVIQRGTGLILYEKWTYIDKFGNNFASPLSTIEELISDFDKQEIEYYNRVRRQSEKVLLLTTEPQLFNGEYALVGTGPGVNEVMDKSGRIVLSTSDDFKRPQGSADFLFYRWVHPGYLLAGRGRGFIGVLSVGKKDWVVQPVYLNIGPYSEGLAFAKSEHYPGWGFLGIDGKWAILPNAKFGMPYMFDGRTPLEQKMLTSEQYPVQFSEGLAAVTDGSDVVKVKDCVGYIDRNGSWIIPPQFRFAGPFHDGIAEVIIYKNGGYRQAYIEKDGRIIWMEN
jgi:hypothetical protein